MGTVASHGLVDRVVYRLVYQVMQTLLADVADVHCRTLAHGFQSLEHLNVTRGIIRFFIQFFCHFLLIVLMVAKIHIFYDLNEYFAAKKPQKKSQSCDCDFDI